MREPLSTAVEMHQKGRFGGAARLYRELLASEPENAEAPHSGTLDRDALCWHFPGYLGGGRRMAHHAGWRDPLRRFEIARVLRDRKAQEAFV